MIYQTKTYQETESLAQKVLAKVINKNIICLSGELGTGKTTFVRGLARNLGITKRILSPTFVLLRQYKVNDKKSRFDFLYHLDCYRLQKSQDLEVLGMREIINDKKNLLVIEWPEIAKSVFHLSFIDIIFKYEKTGRKIEIIY